MIRNLFDQLQVPADKREAALAKRGAASIRNLTHEAAAAFIGSLEAKLPKVVNQDADAVGESRMPSEAVTSTQNDPCSEVQIAEVKSAIADAKKYDADITTKIKKILTTKGLNLIADLTQWECSNLLSSLAKKEMEHWAETAIKGHKELAGIPF